MMTSETRPSDVPESVSTWDFRMSPRPAPPEPLAELSTAFNGTSTDSDSMTTASGPRPATCAHGSATFNGPANSPRPARVNDPISPPLAE